MRGEETGVLSCFSVLLLLSIVSLVSGLERSPPHWLIKCAPSLSSATILLANPFRMAARGMLLTTQLSSLCAAVCPPAALIAPSPSAPSSPMPVMITPTAAAPYSCATEWNRTSAEGRWPFTGGASERMATSPRGIRRTIKWRVSGDNQTRPPQSQTPRGPSLPTPAQHPSPPPPNIYPDTSRIG